MNTQEYKLFISEVKKSLSEKKILKYTDNELFLKSLFSNYSYARKIAANIRVKNINNIEENIILLDKKFNENKININWALDYDNLNTKIIKYLNNNKIKDINIIETNFTRELGIDKSLNEEGFSINGENNDLVIFQPLYLISNTGSFFLNFSSYSQMNMVLNSKHKLFIIPFSDIIRNQKDIEILLKLYYSNKYNEEFGSYSSIYTPLNDSNIEVYIIDNGRTNLLETRENRKALTCFDCDACKLNCPVYQLIGDKPYNNVFTGPYANVVLPYLENIDSYKHLSFNCVLCGNCTNVCPLNIPLKSLMISNRNMFYEMKYIGLKYRNKIKRLKNYLISRKKLNSKQWKKTLYFNIFIERQNKNNRILPVFSKLSLNQIIEKENEIQ